MRKRACYFFFIRVLLSGILVSTESEENCTVKEHLPCKLYRGIQDCSPPGLQQRFPDLYLNDSWPSKASSFEANMTEDYYMQHGLFAKGTFTFTPPHDGSIKLLKGFEVMRYRSDQASPTCYIYDLSNATWKSGTEDFETIFSLILHPMQPDALYVLDLYTLPKLPPQYENYKDLILTVRTAARSDGTSAHDWRASVSYQLDIMARNVIVSFTKPLEAFGFTEFEVTLKNLTDGGKQSVYIAEYKHTFTDVVSGIYEIWVMPLKEKGGCSCRDGFACHVCSTTRTANFTFDFDPLTSTASSTSSTSVVTQSTSAKVSTSGESVTQSTTPIGSTSKDSVTTSSTNKQTVSKEALIQPSTDKDTVTEVQVALAVVGSLLGIGLVVGMLALYYFCRRKSAGDENDNYKPNDIDDDVGSTVTVEAIKKGALVNNHNAEKVKLEQRPKMFVLYEEDHPCHRKVVDSFTLYLQHHCNCDVMSAQLRLDTTWVHQEIQNADYVIIVNSKLAYGIYKSLLSKNRGQIEHTDSGNIKVPGINCILQRFLQEPRYDKTVMVYFDYTNEDHIIPDICPGYNYKLMKNFTDLLLHIHKLKRTDNLAQYDLPLDGKYYLKPTGKDLQTAIRNAATYERENPDWFTQKYGYLRSFSNASDESGFDSGLPMEPIFLDPVSAQLRGYIDATSQDAITVSPPVLTHYGGQTYLALSPHSFQPHIYNSSNQETPTTADSGGQFDFLPPDDISGFETASKSQSEQMLSINARNIGHDYDNKGYDWKQDLNLLRVQSGEIPFSDSQSLGGESV